MLLWVDARGKGTWWRYSGGRLFPLEPEQAKRRRAIALELAREGCNVAVNYRRHDAEADAIVEEIGKLGRKGLAAGDDGVKAKASKSARILKQTCGSCHAGYRNE